MDQKEHAEREFRLRALHADCDLKILLYDLYTSLRGTASDPGELQRLSDIRLTNLLKTVEDNADQAKDLSRDDDNIYVRFIIFKGQALNRRGHTAIALEELNENALPRISKLNKHLQATLHYNLSCYACLENKIEDSLKHLTRILRRCGPTDDFKS